MDWTHTWFGVQGKGREKGPKFSKSGLHQISNKGKLFGLCVLHILATAYVFLSLKAQNNCHDTNKKSYLEKKQLQSLS